MERENGLPECHPASEYFPLLDGREFLELVASIKENGQREPIVVDDRGRIIDGRNRYRACIAADVEPVVRAVAWTEAEVLAFILDVNITRRHLDAGQRAMCGALLLRDLRAAVGPSAGDHKTGKSGDKMRNAAERMNVARSTIAVAAQVLDNAPDLARMVQLGEISLNRAREILEARAAEKAGAKLTQRRRAGQKALGPGQQPTPGPSPLTEGEPVDIDADQGSPAATDDDDETTDGTGATIPGHLVPIFAAGRQLAKVLAGELASVANAISERVDILDARGVLNDVRQSARRVIVCAPFAVCPGCRGAAFGVSATCTWCRSRGWFNATAWRSIKKLNPQFGDAGGDEIDEELEASARSVANADLNDDDPTLDDWQRLDNDGGTEGVDRG